jgi:hypothetical protein
MANHSVQELLDNWQGTSQAKGWGALVAYDRPKCNMLLNQLSIERFTSGQELLFPELELSTEHTTELLTNLRLGYPKLNFVSANLDLSLVDVTLDMRGGLIVTHFAAVGVPPRIDRIQKLFPIGSPKLIMKLNLADNSGSVGPGGAVILDIANGFDYIATFMISNLSQIEIGARFQEIFKALPPEQKRFSFGILLGDLNGPLTPTSFKLRTMPAPGATQRGADNEGDGCVLCFIAMQNRPGGGFPGTPFKYPIPASTATTDYSGCILLSSQLLMRELIKPQLIAQVGNGVDYDDPNTTDQACVLTATQGQIGIKKIYRFTNPLDVTTLNLSWDHLPLADEHKVTFGAGELHVGMRCTFTVPVSINVKGGSHDWTTETSVDIHVNIADRLKAYINEAGEISFRGSNIVYDVRTEFKTQWQGHWPPVENSFEEEIRATVHNALRQLTNLSVADVNTFLIRNLLFPNHNALILSDSYVTGDLVGFGDLDRERTSFSITPLDPVIQAGTKQQFETSQPIENPVWSLIDPDAKAVNLGHIDQSGCYTAPPLGELPPSGTLFVVIKAVGTLAGKRVEALALASVMAQTLAVYPRFQCVAAGRDSTLSAESMGGAPIVWRLADGENGTLDPSADGRTCIFTPPPQDSSKAPWYIIRVEAQSGTARGIVELLMLNKTVSFVVTVDHSPAPGKLKFKVTFDGEDTGEIPLDWHLVTGGGALVDGVYTEPEPGSHEFAVIGVSYGAGMFQNSGFIVVPLPLSEYLPAIMRSSGVLLKQARRYIG